MFAVVRAVQASAADGKAHRAEVDAGIAKLLPSNKYERQNLLGALGYASILAPPDHPGYRERFLTPSERHARDSANGEWAYPFGMWRAIHGINIEAQREIFPQREVEVVTVVAPALQKGGPPALRHLHPLLRSALAALPKRPALSEGDAYDAGGRAPEVDGEMLLILARSWLPLLRSHVPADKLTRFDDGERSLRTVKPGAPEQKGLTWYLRNDGSPALSALGHIFHAHFAKPKELSRSLVAAVGKLVKTLQGSPSGLAAARRFAFDLDEELQRLELQRRSEGARPPLGPAVSRVLYRGGDAREAVWVARLADGGYGCFVARKKAGTWVAGERDDVLASVPDAHFGAAVARVLRSERGPA